MEKRVYFKNHKDGHTYRQDNYGFDVDTLEVRILIKDLSTGERWDMPFAYLTERFNNNGHFEKIWERMPEDWYPTKRPDKPERAYPGYTDDPREEVDNNGYNVYGVRHTNRSTEFDNTNRKRAGFKGR